jgi:hypothetical protein
MAFTVIRKDGSAKDSEFEAYARLSRHTLVFCGKMELTLVSCRVYQSRALDVVGCTYGTLRRKLRSSLTS